MRDTKSLLLLLVSLLLVLVSFVLIWTWGYSYYTKTESAKNIVIQPAADSMAIANKVRDSLQKVYDETLQQERNNAYEIRNGIEAKYAERNENKNEIDVELPF